METLTILAALKRLKDQVATVKAKEGPKGDKGEAGAPGKDGKDGKDGAKGERGPQGPRGASGAKGDEGPKGDKGEDGTSFVDAYIAADGQLVLVKDNGEEISLEIGPLFGEEAQTIIHSTVVSRLGFSNGGSTLRWIEYTTGFNSDPVLLETIPRGDVYSYNYSFGTLYRLIGPAEDSFYETFTSPDLSGLVATKQL